MSSMFVCRGSFSDSPVFVSREKGIRPINPLPFAGVFAHHVRNSMGGAHVIPSPLLPSKHIRAEVDDGCSHERVRMHIASGGCSRE